jgi:hypothetical protein
MSLPFLVDAGVSDPRGFFKFFAVTVPAFNLNFDPDPDPGFTVTRFVYTPLSF